MTTLGNSGSGLCGLLGIRYFLVPPVHRDSLGIPESLPDTGARPLLIPQELAQVPLADADLTTQAKLVSVVRVHFGKGLRGAVHGSRQDIPSEKLVKRETPASCHAVPVSPTKKTRIAEIGPLIAKARKALGLTQVEIYKKLKISQSSLSKLENGRVGLESEDMLALLGLLAERGIDVTGFIFRRDTDEPIKPRDEQTALLQRVAALERRAGGTK